MATITRQNFTRYKSKRDTETVASSKFLYVSPDPAVVEFHGPCSRRDEKETRHTCLSIRKVRGKERQKHPQSCPLQNVWNKAWFCAIINRYLGWMVLSGFFNYLLGCYEKQFNIRVTYTTPLAPYFHPRLNSNRVSVCP